MCSTPKVSGLFWLMGEEQLEQLQWYFQASKKGGLSPFRATLGAVGIGNNPFSFQVNQREGGYLQTIWHFTDHFWTTLYAEGNLWQSGSLSYWNETQKPTQVQNPLSALSLLRSVFMQFKLGRLDTYLEENWFIAENKDHIHQVVSWCIETAPNLVPHLGPERGFHFIKFKPVLPI